MILLVDNYDSFSYNLYQLLGALHPEIRVIRNDQDAGADPAGGAGGGDSLSGPRTAGTGGILHGDCKDPGGTYSHSGCLPGPSGYLRCLWSQDHLCGKTHARKAVPGRAGRGKLGVPGTPKTDPGGPLPFTGGGGGNPASGAAGDSPAPRTEK